jgi:hypothetical protein
VRGQDHRTIGDAETEAAEQVQAQRGPSGIRTPGGGGGDGDERSGHGNPPACGDLAVDGALTGKSRLRRTLMHMTGVPWRVIVIRGWRDGDDVRVRVLTSGGGDRQWTGTASAAPDLVRQVLAELEDEGDVPAGSGRDG